MQISITLTYYFASLFWIVWFLNKAHTVEGFVTIYGENYWAKLNHNF